MSTFQPPPTWALPIIVEQTTKQAIFNPVWLKWFVDLTKALGTGGSGSGTVTSVAASGGATGLSFSGTPITTSGTLTLTGTLAVGNGGTGVTTATGTGSVVRADSPTFTTKVTLPGAATLLFTTAALTNNAAGNVGTLNNAPAAGNPTKWIAINDAGTTRYIPAW